MFDQAFLPYFVVGNFVKIKILSSLQSSQESLDLHKKSRADKAGELGQLSSRNGYIKLRRRKHISC